MMRLPTVDYEYTIMDRYKQVMPYSFQWRIQKISLVRSQELRKITRQYRHNFVDLNYDRKTQLLNITEKRDVKF